MCITYSVYYVSWLQVFQFFKFLFFQVRSVNHFQGHVIVRDIEHRLQENILYYYLHCSFLLNTAFFYKQPDSLVKLLIAKGNS